MTAPKLPEGLEPVAWRVDWPLDLIDSIAPDRFYDASDAHRMNCHLSYVHGVAAPMVVPLVRQADHEAAYLAMEARKDAAYLERNQVVAALAAAFPSGIARTAIEGWSEDWHGCVYIDLPTGQVSWHFHDSHAHLFAHLPPYAGAWDGHDTEEKYRRLSDAQAALQALAAEHAAEIRRIRDIRNENAEDYRTEIRLCREEIAALKEDAARMDWLMQHTVNVRVHLRYGSRNLFWAGPEDGDGEILPSDLRDRIDSALALAAKEAK